MSNEGIGNNLFRSSNERNTKRRQFVATVGATGVAGCSAFSVDDEVETLTSSPKGGNATVEMKTDGEGNYFDPVGLYLIPGDSVTFITKSGNHSAMAYHKGNIYAEANRIPKDAAAWGSKVLQKGKSYEHTFEAVGTHGYYCIPHKTLGMLGRIIVEKPSGPAEGSMSPDVKVPTGDLIPRKGSVSHSDFTK